MAKYAVCGGHTILTNGYSTSANGIHNELTQDRLIRDSVIKYLRIDGNEVYDCSTPDRTVASQSEDLSYKAKKVNSYNVDLAIDIHLNSASESAVGTETFIYVTGGKAEEYAKRVNSNLVSIGFRDRGVKVNSNLAFLRNTNCAAILVESYFCSSPSDCALAEQLGTDLIGKKIAEGIVGHIIEEQKPIIEIPLPSDFSESYYLHVYNDVVEAIKNHVFESGAQHYVLQGHKENRIYKPELPSDFNELYYIMHNEDVRLAVENKVFASGKDHWIKCGWSENRQFKPTLPIDYSEIGYLTNNVDIEIAVKGGIFKDGADHWLQFGWSEGRDYFYHEPVEVEKVYTKEDMDKIKSDLITYIDNYINGLK